MEVIFIHVTLGGGQGWGQFHLINSNSNSFQFNLINSNSINFFQFKFQLGSFNSNSVPIPN